MTKLLEKAVDVVSKLPTRDQNALARGLLRECEGLRTKSVKPSRQKAGRADVDGPVPPKLAKLIAEAKREERAGKVYEMGWDEL